MIQCWPKEIVSTDGCIDSEKRMVAGEVARSKGLALQAGGHKFILQDPIGESWAWQHATIIAMSGTDSAKLVSSNFSERSAPKTRSRPGEMAQKFCSQHPH